MKTDDGWIGRRLDAERFGTKALVAVEGFFEPGRECLAGELLLPTVWCGRRGCSCGFEFHSVTTHGNASVARVRRMPGVPRALVEATLAEAMRHHTGYGRAETAAAELLDEVAEIEDGRLVRREEGVLLPFPTRARITGSGSIEYHVSDEP